MNNVMEMNLDDIVNELRRAHFIEDITPLILSVIKYWEINPRLINLERFNKLQERLKALLN